MTKSLSMLVVVALVMLTSASCGSGELTSAMPGASPTPVPITVSVALPKEEEPVPTPIPTWKLTGTVTESGTGKTIGGATVTIVDGPNATRSVTTDANGFYTMPGLVQSGFTVRATAPGYGWSEWAVILTQDRVANIGLRPAPAPAPAPAPVYPEYEVSGIIWTTSPTRPLPGVTLEVMTPENIKGRHTMTRSDGRYSLNLAAPWVTIRISATGFVTRDVSIKIDGPVLGADFKLER